MSRPSFSIRSCRVVLPDGLRSATLHIADGKIARVSDYAHADIDAGDLVIAPGLVDTHVHINEPGRTEWEGFDSATRAAAAGGVTTLIEMPLNSIPATTSLSGYQTKLSAAEGRCWVDVGFWGGVIPGNTHELQPLFEAGCFGFKCFLTPSGVDEFPNVELLDLAEAKHELHRLGAPLLVHAELPDELHVPCGDPAVYRNYLDSRPCQAEDAAISGLLKLGLRTHIVHLVSAGSIDQLRHAKLRGEPVTVETCPHYLTFCSEEIPNGATEFKCAPPIREKANQDRLWEALREGVVDMIATDHSPCPPSMKPQGDFFTAWGGIASVQLGLAAVWTEAHHRGFTIPDLFRWMSVAPAKLAGLGHRKGSLIPGSDADFIVWDPDATWTVDPTQLHHRHKMTPYANRDLRGVVQKTYLRGVEIDLTDKPRGHVLKRV